MSVLKTPNAETIAEAAAMIRGGDLVAFPTETVYGLGANALDGQAVARIYEAKGRPSFNPLIAHFCDVAQMQDYIALPDRAKEWFDTLAHHIWPGPLTLIVSRAEECKISELATAGLETVAVRIPAHLVARDLIKQAGVPIVAPSANLSGTISPTTPAHVAEGLGDKVGMILAGGACTVGLESTVLDLSEEKPVILRPGAVTKEQMEELLNTEIFYIIQDKREKDAEGADKGASQDVSGEAVKAPGMLLKHYAPSIPVRLNAVDLEPGEALLAFGSDKFMGIKGGGAAKDLPEEQRRNLSEEGDLNEAAANLFSMMRALDKPENKGIAVMSIPDEGLGVAINDRLRRAAQK